MKRYTKLETHKPELVTVETFDDCLRFLKSQPLLAFDTETSGLNPWTGDYVAGVSFTGGGRSMYFPFHHISPGGVWVTFTDGETLYISDIKPAQQKKLDAVDEWKTTNRQGLGEDEPPYDILSYEVFPEAGALWPEQLPLPWLRLLLRLLWKRIIVGHNLKFDIHQTFLTARRWVPDWEIKNEIPLIDNCDMHDTIVMAKNIDHSAWSVGLKKLAEKIWPGAGDDERKLIALMKARKHPKQYHKVKPTEMAPYACKDTELTLGLFYRYTQGELPRLKIESLYEQERRVLKTLIKMERNGIRYMKAERDRLKQTGSAAMEMLQRKLFKEAGRDFNPNSDEQVSEVFANEFGINLSEFSQTTYAVKKENAKRQRQGKKLKELSTNKDVMEELGHPFGLTISNYRLFAAHMAAYVEPLEELGQLDGRIHTNFNLTGTATGRLSSNSPNVQNLPKKPAIEKLHGKLTPKLKELGGKFFIRNLFHPTPGFIFVLIDYSQIEYRLMAHYCEDENMLIPLRNGEDLHQATTDNINHLVGEIVLTRDGGKACNFLQIYGGGIPALALMIHQPESVCHRVLDAYHENQPRVREFIEEVKGVLVQKGFVRNLYGARYYLPPELAYKGVNYLCQGGAAFMIKEKMAAIDRWLVSNNAQDQIRLLLQIHDELVFEVARDAVDDFVNGVVPIMEDFNEPVPGLRDGLILPITVDVDIAPNGMGEKLAWKGSLTKTLKGKSNAKG